MEGEPASDKDKLLLIRSPHVVLDGAQLLAAATGAAQVIVCVPAGREQVAAATAHALAERAAAGWAPVAEQLVRPPDRFVAGEESALVQWVESGRSLPSFRPDKGTPLRLGRRTALIHNVETLAHVGMIARFGAEAFRSTGPIDDPGTSLVTISGAVSTREWSRLPGGLLFSTSRLGRTRSAPRVHSSWVATAAAGLDRTISRRRTPPCRSGRGRVRRRRRR